MTDTLGGTANSEQSSDVDLLLRDPSTISLISELLVLGIESTVSRSEMSVEFTKAMGKCLDILKSTPGSNNRDDDFISITQVDEILDEYPAIREIYGMKDVRNIVRFLFFLKNADATKKPDTYYSPKSLNLTTHSQHNPCHQKDFLYALFDSFLGIESEYFTYSPEKSRFVLLLHSNIPLTFPEISMINSILSLGTYHQKITDILMTEYYMCNQSLYVKIFVNAVNEELQDYITKIVSAQEIILNDNDNPLTLIRLYKLSLQYIKILQLLSAIVEECYGKKWYHILSYLYKCVSSEVTELDNNIYPDDQHYASNLFAGKNIDSSSLCVEKRFQEVFSAFFKALHAWIIRGDVIFQDEFFIVKNLLSEDDTDIWTSKFYLDLEALPSFVKEDTANKILYLGKTYHLITMLDLNSVYFSIIRYIIPDEPNTPINMSNFSEIVDRICSLADKILNDTIKKVCDILQISKFLQNTLLLSNSHFSHSLIAELIPHLADTSKCYFKNGALLPIEPVVLDAVPRNLSQHQAKNIRVSFLQNTHGKNAMMDFILISYSAEFPESLFLTRQALKKYESAFIFIWNIIRLRYIFLEGSKQRLKLLQTVSKVSPESSKKLCKVTVGLYKMGCFLTTFMQHININCLECARNELKRNIEKASNFDLQLEAYKLYINKLDKQISFYNDSLVSQIHKILSLIQKCLGYSGVIQLAETHKLLNDRSFEAFHLELMKHENIILEGIEFQAIICGLTAKLETYTDMELEKYYFEFESAMKEFENSANEFGVKLMEQSHMNMYNTGEDRFMC